MKDYNLSTHYHPEKANVITDTLSRKSNASIATLITTQKHILEDLRRLDIDIHARGSNVMFAHLRLKPTLLERIVVEFVRYRLLKQYETRNCRVVSQCSVCQQVKVEHQKPSCLLEPLPVLALKWKEITMDFVTGLPRSQTGTDMIWVIVEWLISYLAKLLILCRNLLSYMLGRL